jgi:hypothetical protein
MERSTLPLMRQKHSNPFEGNFMRMADKKEKFKRYCSAANDAFVYSIGEKRLFSPDPAVKELLTMNRTTTLR